VIEVIHVYAFSAVSAADRELVERVRLHILPADAITFDSLDGEPVTVGGSDLVGGYLATLELYREERGSTYTPILVEHCGAAVGMLVHYESDASGLWAVADLWAEGVAARKGRDFVSAWWEFGDRGDDGRPHTAKAHEISFTAIPQFARAQTPVAAIGDPEESPMVAATLVAAAYSTSPRGIMTPEEMAAALLGLDEFKTALSEMIAEAIAAATPEDDPEDEAPEGDEAVEVEVTDSVAASLVAALDALNTKIDRVERATKVAASLRTKSVNQPTIGGPSPGVDYINERLSAGVSLSDAYAENVALTKGA